MMQVLSGGSNDALNPAATEYIAFWPTVNNTWNATESTRRQLISSSGRIKHLRVKLSTGPGGGGAYIFTLRKNGAATSLSVTITDPATTGVDLTNEATFVAGDYISFECAPSGSPTGTPPVTWCAVYEDTINYNTCVFLAGINNAPSTSLAERSSIAGGLTWTVNALNSINSNCITAIPGSVSSMYVLLSAAPGVGKSYTYRTIANGVNTLAVSVSGTSTSGGPSIGGGSITRGETLSVSSTPSGTPTSAQVFWSCNMLSSNPHEFMLFGQSSSDLPSAGTQYNILNGTGLAWDSTERNRRILVPSGVAHGLIVKLGKPLDLDSESFTFTVMKNGSATALTCTIVGAAAEQAEDIDPSHAIYCSDGDELSLRVEVGAGETPTGFDCAWAVVYRKAHYSLSQVGAGI